MISPVERGVYLASRSPRRRELLAQIGVRFHLLLFRSRPGEDPDVDEEALPNEAPDVYVLRLARSKAGGGWPALVAANPAARPGARRRYHGHHRRRDSRQAGRPHGSRHDA